MAGRKSRFGAALFIALLGILPLLNSLGNPRLAALHGADILRLIAVGFCFGVAFALMLSVFTGQRARQADA